VRLDQAISARYPDISRRKARELIAGRRVLVNERAVSIASRHVEPGDRIAVVNELPEIAIIRETVEWVAVDKPVGMPVQPPRDREERSLEELLRLRFHEIWLVHRLDTPTSGVVLFAKTATAAAKFSALFAAAQIQKTYLAILEGELREARVVETTVQGKNATSTFRPLQSDGATTLAEVVIATGRTHQIRVHAASIDHPVVGDRRYGSGLRAKRLMLHAWKLEHASFGVLEAPPPTSFSYAPPSPR
jgi:RluA family pseudouridine synthase